MKADVIVLSCGSEYDLLRDCEGRDADDIAYNALKDWSDFALMDVHMVYVAQNVTVTMDIIKALRAEKEEAREEARKAERAEMLEESERAELARLKAKYER